MPPTRKDPPPVTVAPTSQQVFRFTVDGQEVLCYQIGTDRLWHCACEYFQERLKLRHQGFCQHTARAIIQAMREGTIHFDY
jgi:hypothetical protein